MDGPINEAKASFLLISNISQINHAYDVIMPIFSGRKRQMTFLLGAFCRRNSYRRSSGQCSFLLNAIRVSMDRQVD